MLTSNRTCINPGYEFSGSAGVSAFAFAFTQLPVRCRSTDEFKMADEPDAKRPKRIEDSLVAQERNVVLIIDYGSQYTQLITRRCRSMIAALPGSCLASRSQHNARVF